MDNWNPDTYLIYEEERTQPSYDLVSRIDIANPATIVDVGCGPGNSTRVLRERWPDASITGLDSSREMIERAKTTYPEENWILADATQWKTDDHYDIVFSNATLQWIHDHEGLIGGLFDRVNQHGALAVQLPANDHAPLHEALLRVSKREEWKEVMVGCDKRLTSHNVGFYYDLLSRVSKRIYIWETTYHHVMADHQGLIDWYAGTAMRSYLERVTSDEERNSFQKQVLEESSPYYPKQQNSKVLFPFNRLFFVAYKE